MAIEPGLKARYLQELGAAIQHRIDKRGQLVDRLQLAMLEDRAQSALTVEDNTLLASAGIVDRESASALKAECDALTAEIKALKRLCDAVRGVS